MRMIRYYGMEQGDEEYRNPGSVSQTYMQERDTPVIPLPNPGEGGPVYDGMMTEQEQPGNVFPGQDASQIPVIPLPNPGEGGAVSPNPSWRPLPSFTPNIRVRFVNAANGYEAFTIYLNNRMFVNSLAFRETTEYETVSKGDSVVSLVGPDGYVYYQKPYRFTGCRNLTIVILNTGSNLELLELPEHNCK